MIKYGSVQQFYWQLLCEERATLVETTTMIPACTTNDWLWKTRGIREQGENEEVRVSLFARRNECRTASQQQQQILCARLPVIHAIC